MNKLTDNFLVSEVTDWPRWQNLSSKDRSLLEGWIAETMANSTNKLNILSEAKKIAVHKQDIRDKVNAAFPEFEGKIGIRSVCWLRPVAWEKHRGRSGAGMHPTGNASDITVTNVLADKYQVVMSWIWDYLNGKNGGKVWNGGLARLHRGGRTSFIHIDLGRNRRWDY
jgi:hypothetical protein